MSSFLSAKVFLVPFSSPFPSSSSSSSSFSPFKQTNPFQVSIFNCRNSILFPSGHSLPIHLLQKKDRIKLFSSKMENDSSSSSSSPLIPKEKEVVSQIEEIQVVESDGNTFPNLGIIFSIFSFSAIIIACYFFQINPLEIFQNIKEKIKYFVENSNYNDPNFPFYFSFIYIFCALVLFPASILTLLAGYIFGLLKGTLIVSISSITAASLSFLFSRYMARPFFSKNLISKNAKFQKLDEALAMEGWKIVFLFRLSPLFPFSISNYMFGLTGVDFLSYFFSSWAAMLPGTFAYVYLGSAGRATVDAIFEGEGNSAIDQPIKLIFYGIGIIATLLVTREISIRASKALKLDEEEDVKE